MNMMAELSLGVALEHYFGTIKIFFITIFLMFFSAILFFLCSYFIILVPSTPLFISSQVK
jgi:hypothetical protein